MRNEKYLQNIVDTVKEEMEFLFGENVTECTVTFIDTPQDFARVIIEVFGDTYMVSIGDEYGSYIRIKYEDERSLIKMLKEQLNIDDDILDVIR